jgi:hypothetical protein
MSEIWYWQAFFKFFLDKDLFPFPKKLEKKGIFRYCTRVFYARAAFYCCARGNFWQKMSEIW